MRKTGDLFVIEIAEEIVGKESGFTKYRIKGFDSLVFDEKELAKIETIHRLQDLVPRAWNDAKKYGADMAWDCVKALGELNTYELLSLFDNTSIQFIVEHYSAFEVMHKLAELKNTQNPKVIEDMKI